VAEENQVPEENVIVIENEDDQQNEQNGKKGKFFYLIIILLLIIIIMLLVLTAVVVMKKKKNKPVQKEISTITEKLEKKHLTQKDEIKQLIKKAGILYEKGEKQKALEILNKLSSYSEALSYYNLGVIKLEEKNYKSALEYFQKAINNKDNRALSAINSAYSALMLNNKKLFNYYRSLAYTFLPELAKLKSYPYYYAVVMYYMGYEYEAIKALKIPTPYKEHSDELLSAIYQYYGDFEKAQELEKKPFFKGMSLARIGEYTLAKHYLSMSEKDEAKFAIALIDLKLALYKESSRILKQFDKNIYPINVYLKESLFDIKTAQKEFKKSFLKSKDQFYDIFFYYAPYKVFNMNQTISYLKKGVAGIPIGAIEESQSYLNKSATYSALNLKISNILKLALNGHIYLANRDLQKLIKQKPNSYILHYDLALTFAQLGDYQNAYAHFLRAYHLNPNDLKSGIYALMALDKLKKSNDYLVSSIKEDFNDNTELEEAMLAVVQNNLVRLSAFLEKEPKNKPVWIITRLTAKELLKKDFSYEALTLKSIYPKDIIANLLYFYSTNSNLPIYKFALNYQSFFFSQKLNMDDFYYGAKIVREWYFKFAKISGLLNKVRLSLIDRAKKETFDLIPILKRVAFANLYTKHFEEAYVIYNDLINNKHISDPHTLYHAGVSAIGAGHHSNAVVLMELAKLKDPSFYESRYALGLLWEEAGNLKASSIQYSKIPDGFESKYFDFNIKQY